MDVSLKLIRNEAIWPITKLFDVTGSPLSDMASLARSCHGY
jgi:hypothetical protein